MTSYIEKIINDKSLIENQNQIISDVTFQNRKSKKDIFNETLIWFKKDKPKLTEKELKNLTNEFLLKIEKILK